MTGFTWQIRRRPVLGTSTASGMRVGDLLGANESNWAFVGSSRDGCAGQGVGCDGWRKSPEVLLRVLCGLGPEPLDASKLFARPRALPGTSTRGQQSVDLPEKLLASLHLGAQIVQVRLIDGLGGFLKRPGAHLCRRENFLQFVKMVAHLSERGVPFQPQMVDASVEARRRAVE
jgi:hypothetical protein